MTGLPRAYRGRCKQRHPVQTPLIRSPNKARQGDYNLPIDQPTFRLHLHTRQIRRLQSLARRLTKVHHLDSTAQHHAQVHEEWSKICKATGFHGGFQHWLQSHPETTDLPTALPTFTLHTNSSNMRWMLRLTSTDRSVSSMQSIFGNSTSDTMENKKHLEHCGSHHQAS